jgi:glycerol kinase
MQFTADVTRMKIAAAEVSESSAWGAAMNGFLGLGIHRSLRDLAALPRKFNEFKPNMSLSRVQHIHAQWLTAVGRVL